ncbi:DUF1615 family protein, partial [Salmonella enterica]|uniref:DUF1615 family protein n=1 Tax=Salmonella enterica TaxID=28901 RepID=UPI0002AEAEA1
SVLAVAQQESGYQADPVVPGLSKIAWQEIDRRAERLHIPLFLVHTALKINSPNGKSYSERLDTVLLILSPKPRGDENHRPGFDTKTPGAFLNRACSGPEGAR